MKHVQPYQEFINEASEHKEISRQEFNDLAVQTVGNKELYRWDPLTREEEASLISLYHFIDVNGGDGSYCKKLIGDDLRFRIVINQDSPTAMFGYPRIQIGKLSSNLWTVDTSDDITGEIYLTNSYNTFPSLQDAIAFIADKYGPKIKWEQIK